MSFIMKLCLFICILSLLHNAVHIISLHSDLLKSLDFLSPLQLALHVWSVLSLISLCIRRYEPPWCDDSYMGLCLV